MQDQGASIIGSGDSSLPVVQKSFLLSSHMRGWKRERERGRQEKGRERKGWVGEKKRREEKGREANCDLFS